VNVSNLLNGFTLDDCKTEEEEEEDDDDDDDIGKGWWCIS